MCNFIQNCLTGDALLDEIDDYIDEWHGGDSKLPLYTYLGMSREEYGAWLEAPDTLTYIIAAHKRNISYRDAMSQAAAMAARSNNINSMSEIEEWLNEEELDI